MSPARAFEKISPVAQAFVWLGGAVSFGMMVAFLFAGWVQLPEKVEHQGDAIVELREDVGSLKRDVPRMRCILEAMAAKEEPLRRCGL